MPNYTENHFLHSTVKQLRAYIFNFDLEIFSYTQKKWTHVISPSAN